MRSSTRLLVALLATTASVPRARGEVTTATPNPQAEKLNEDGKSLYSEQHDYIGAAQKFRDAIAIAPDARYWFNLCSAEAKLERFEQALEACDEVYSHDPRPELAEKAGKRAAEIRKSIKAAKTPVPVSPPPVSPPPVNPPPPNNVPPENPYGPAEPPGFRGSPGPGTPAGPAAPETAVQAKVDPGLDYRWSLGAELGFVHNGSVGDALFARTGGSVKLHADFLVSRSAGLGVQPYLDLSLLGGSRDSTGQGRQLTIVDIGAALYWHRHLWKGLWLTPLAGVHLTGLNPYGAQGSNSFGTFGFRFEGGLDWVFGSGRHVLSLVPLSLNVYLPAAVSGGTAELYGFDHAGVTWAFTVGYTIRFQSSIFPGLMLE